MKSFREYLTESTQTYEYRIKIAGDLESDTLKAFETALSKFDLLKMSDPIKTPVTESPLDFPHLKNVDVHIFDIETAYPAGQQALQEVAKSLGIDGNHFRIMHKTFDEGWKVAEDKVQEEGSKEGKDGEGALLNAEYSDPTKEQKEASDKYANPEKNIENPGNAKFEIAGGKTDPVVYNIDSDSLGNKSPAGSTKNKLPEPKASIDDYR